MHTKRLIAGTRHPIPAVGGLDRELPVLWDCSFAVFDWTF
jgi:hypothetical protein